MTKARVTVTVDLEPLAAARAAVAAGKAASVSEWVNEAMRRRAEHEGRLAALAAFFALYEAEHGVITEEEMRDARQWAKERAISVRPDS